MPECFLAVEHGTAVPFSRRISSEPHPSRLHRSSKQFKALQDKLNVQLFVVTDETGRTPLQVIERRKAPNPAGSVETRSKRFVMMNPL
jgi:hypothetical protein